MPEGCANATGPQAKRTRYSSKSRAGCRTCKSRKVKCDEARPECGPCVKFGVQCGFLFVSDEEQQSRPTVTSPSAHHQQPSASLRRQPGRPRNAWVPRLADAAAPNAENVNTSRESPAVSRGDTRRDIRGETRWETQGDTLGGAGEDVSGQQEASCRPVSHSGFSASPPSVSANPELPIEELSILHHYITATVPTFGQPHIWSNGVPRLAHEHPGLFHGMLALGAYHMSQTQDLRAPRLRMIGERHYAAALRHATALMANITIDNAQAAYALANLVCYTSFAKGPDPGDLVLVAADGVVPWLHLMRGVRLTIERFGVDVVLSGILSPRAQAASRPDNCRCSASDDPPRVRYVDDDCWDWRASLARLDETVGSSLPHVKAVAMRAQIQGLTRCFEALTEERHNTASTEANSEDYIAVMSWVYGLEDPFVDSLLCGDPASLLVLGFFGVLLSSIRGFWWLQGWGDHVLTEVRRLLGSSEYDTWLPRRHA